MKNVKTLLPGFLLLVTFLSSCNKNPVNLTLQPGAETGKDAYLRSLTPDSNYGTHPDFTSEAVTNDGNYVAVRCIIDFDLSSIPSTADITDAKLYLYTYNSPRTGQHLGTNLSYLQRITSDWDEMSVTWNTAPATTVLHQATLPTSTSEYENYVVDVKDLVQDYIVDKEHSFGFMLRLADESIYNRMIFASSDNTDSGIHPKLVLTYQL